MSDKKELRSRQWYGGNSKSAFMHRSWMKNQGIPEDEFDGRPVIGICNTWSETDALQQPSARRWPKRVKRGVWEAGGFPVEFPVLSALGKTQMRPTAMLFRNLLAAMDVEECDPRLSASTASSCSAACDKTTPGQS
jgi:dihydroxyacid dehydratase/phosphogluconate dehydratase